MAPTFEDFIQSPLFTFLVGQEEKPIVVHAAAIAATSPQLDALINGGMEESKTRRAKIKDVEAEDFIRFCEYAYRGDYTVPAWEELPPEPSSTSVKMHQNEDANGWGDWGLPYKRKKKGKKKRQFSYSWDGLDAPAEPAESEPVEEELPEPEPAELEPPMEIPAHSVMGHISGYSLRTRFTSRNYLSDDGGPRALMLQHFEPKSNSTVHQNFTPILLAHARLYCFAHIRMIEPLKALTLDKLHKTLKCFKLYTKRVGDIIELARYAYSNPDLPGRGDDGTLDDLRNLVVEYIVCGINTIGTCDEFVEYLEEGGAFVGDLWRMNVGVR